MFFSNNTARDDNQELPCAKIQRIYHLENDTIEYKLAQESLIAIQHKDTPSDHTTFSDEGDLTLTVLYLELCAAYKHEIKREKLKRLRVIPIKRKR